MLKVPVGPFEFFFLSVLVSIDDVLNITRTETNRTSKPPRSPKSFKRNP